MIGPIPNVNDFGRPEAENQWETGRREVVQTREDKSHPASRALQRTWPDPTRKHEISLRCNRGARLASRGTVGFPTSRWTLARSLRVSIRVNRARSWW